MKSGRRSQVTLQPLAERLFPAEENDYGQPEQLPMIG